MDRITIQELTVFYRVGVPDDERAHTQRLSLTVEMDHDFTQLGDSIERTVDYHTVVQCLLNYGEGRSWRLIETVGVELAEMILRDFKPARVSVEVRKFILPQTRHVSVRVTRPG